MVRNEFIHVGLKIKSVQALVALTELRMSMCAHSADPNCIVLSFLDKRAFTFTFNNQIIIFYDFLNEIPRIHCQIQKGGAAGVQSMCVNDVSLPVTS